MNYLKNNRRMDQDALIEYIISGNGIVAAKSETLPIVRPVDRFCI